MTGVSMHRVQVDLSSVAAVNTLIHPHTCVQQQNFNHNAIKAYSDFFLS